MCSLIFTDLSSIFTDCIGIYSKYAWVAPTKDKEGIIITNGFQKDFK